MNDTSNPPSLESAIPESLKVAAAPAGECLWSKHQPPPYPTFVGRFDRSVRRVAMVYLGVQGTSSQQSRSDLPANHILELLAGPSSPFHFDVAGYRDHLGRECIIHAAYWTDYDRFSRWLLSDGVRDGWAALEAAPGPFGFFREMFVPSMDGFETHFSTHRAEGVAVGATGMSGPIREHGYWGSARERIPKSQTQSLKPRGHLALGPTSEHSNVIRVRPHAGVCLIRSGQDWGDASPDERDLYTKHIEPVLRAGMNFLETQGSAVGCYSNRFVQDLPEGLAQGNKTYGMSLWRSLGHLEEWSSRHKTHLAIFAAGMKHMKAYGADAGLRTYHEISVLEEHEQFYEYVSCHPQTSLLNALSAQPASSPQSAQSSADAVEGWLSSVREADQAGSARGSAGADVGRQVLDT